MKNLTRHRLALGVLMAFVLAFGVQGTTDALTFGTTTGDLQTISVQGQTFTITVDVTATAAVNITNSNNQRVAQNGSTRINDSGYKIIVIDVGGTATTFRPSAAAQKNGYRARVDPEPATPAHKSTTGAYVVNGTTDAAANVVDSQGRAVFTNTGLTDRLTAIPDDPVPVAQRQHYNEQAVRIDIPSGITLTGTYAGTSDVTLTQTVTERDGSKYPFVANITVTGYATSVGEKTIRISDVTPSADRGGNDADDPLTFTIYVTQAPHTVGATTSIRLLGLTNGYSEGNYGYSPVKIYSGSGNYKVTYTVTGGGNLYVQETPERKTTATTSVTTSSAATVYLDFDNNIATQTVTAAVERGATSTGVYIYGYPTLTVGYPSGAADADSNRIKTVDNDDGSRTEGTEANGKPSGSVLADAITVKVEDGVTPDAGSVQGVIVKFEAKGGQFDGGNLIFPSSGNTGILVNRNGIEESGLSRSGKILYVRTSAAGEAKVNFRFGDAREQKAVVTAVGLSKEISLFSNAPGTGKRLSAVPITSSGRKSNLRVIVRDADGIVEDEQVRFRITTGAGALDDTPAAVSNTPITNESFNSTNDPDGAAAATVYDATDEDGVAHVIFTPDATYSGSVRVTASIADTEVASVDFNVRGGSTNQPTNPYLSISPSSLTGSPGESRSFTVYAYNASGNRDSGVSVALSSSGVTVPSSVRTGESVSVTLPSSSTSISATASGYTSRSLSVSVQAVPDEIVKVSGDNQSGTVGASLSSSFVVRVEDSSNNPISGQTVTFQVTSGGGSLSSTSVTTDSSGEASATLTLGSSTGTNTVTASVSGISSVTFTATTEEEELPPDALVIDGSANVIGELNTALDLSVQIVDEDDEGVTGELVLFRITEGSGRLSPSRARTDSDGYAAITLTPRASGTIEVEASSGDLSPVTFTITTGNPPDALVYISGNNQSGKSGTKLANPFVVEVIDEDDEPVSGATVTFAVTAGGGTLSTTSATTGSNGRAQTRLTLGEAIGDNTVVARVSGLTDRVTFKARTGAQVLIDAAQRPPMYWVDSTNGTLHRLIEDEVEDLATNAKGATNIAVDSTNGYIYWTAQTAANKGVIRRAGLNGKGVQTLKTVSTLPMGIAIDAAGGTVYWTNARGNILSMPVSGGKVTNILRNLSSPGPIAISNGVLYWGEAAGSIRKMSLTAKPKTPVNLATGIGEPLAIVIAKGKVYWIEVGGGGSGKLQRVNTNSKNIQQLKAFASGVPLGLTADSSDNKLYWTKRTGKIQRANFAGKYVKDIVSGLPKPGSLAIGVESIATMPAAQGNQQTNTQQANNQQTQQTSDTSKYDVNGDGAVDNLDVTIVALALGTDNLDYDVNGDGSVDANDLRAVIANSDSSGAAPAIEVDLKAMDIDFNRVQEQIEMLLAAGDISLEGQRVLLYLQHLLASARPDETVLLANYPNPFNPETWIPYHLAESTDVAVRIYDAQGTLVRVLTLGHQTAGYYTSRSRAAYWDGRNAIGERVASGVYFYQLQTDAISPMRKMVILK